MLEVAPLVVTSTEDAVAGVTLQVYESYGPGTIRVRIVPRDITQMVVTKVYPTQDLMAGTYSLSLPLEEISYKSLPIGQYSLDILVCEKKCGSDFGVTLARGMVVFEIE
jgi:hypothetical protein